MKLTKVCFGYTFGDFSMPLDDFFLGNKHLDTLFRTVAVVVVVVVAVVVVVVVAAINSRLLSLLFSFRVS
jgi:hypothetical protein